MFREMLKVKVFVARKHWLTEEGSRLDAATFAAGGLEARDRIFRCQWPKRRLGEVCTASYEARFARRYIMDPSRGTPFLTGSDMLLADLRGLLYLSKRATPQMQKLVVRRGWTLMSRSGTIGRTVFVRGEMEGMAGSDDVIRLVPNETVVAPGYLFGFLTSPSGQAMIHQKTYGSVVQHIEPHHIQDLPVPVPGSSEQQRIHDLVAGAADARTEATRLLDAASSYFDRLVDPTLQTHDHARAVGVVWRSDLANRLDAFHHVGWAVESAGLDGIPIGKLGQVWRPPILRRIFVERGIPFVSGIDVYQVRVPFRQRIMRAEAMKAQCILKAGQVLVQRSGQRYGLIGQPAYVSRLMDGWAATEDLMRIDLQEPGRAGTVIAFLRSSAGRRALIRQSYGTSIPHLNPEYLAGTCIPELPQTLASGAQRALELREQADADEEQAIREVEAWLS